MRIYIIHILTYFLIYLKMTTLPLSFDEQPTPKLTKSFMQCEYSNTTEYRNIFRKITHQSTTPPENPFDLDEETLDELHYDESIVSNFLDIVFENTNTNPLFQTLYDLAAAKMISMDREIGLAVLFSYDYFGAFYPCYCEYIRNPKTFSQTNPLYMKIHQKL